MIECSGCKRGWCRGCVPDTRAIRRRPRPLNESTINQLRRQVFIQQSRKAWFEGYSDGASYKFTKYLDRDDLYAAYRRGARHHIDVEKNFPWGCF